MEIVNFVCYCVSIVVSTRTRTLQLTSIVTAPSSHTWTTGFIFPRGAQSSVFTAAASALHRAWDVQATSHLTPRSPRELEHEDLASKVTRDEDLVAAHTNCKDSTLQVDVNSLQDVA